MTCIIVNVQDLDQVYKLYIRPHLDYGDIIYHRFDPEMHLEITKKLEQVQYSVALAVTGIWRGTSRQKLYEELGWETLHHRRWYRRLTNFFCCLTISLMKYHKSVNDIQFAKSKCI